MLHGVFTRGTTPTQIFELPFSAEQIDNVSITYKQKNRVIAKKTLKDCNFEDNKVITSLSQEESLSFCEDVVARVQIKVSIAGKVFASPAYQLGVEEILDEEEI